MNYEENSKAYPCDEPEKSSAYPCDEQESVKAYPCDVPETKTSYPCDTEDEAFFDAQNTPDSANAEPAKKGKGRRGGNAAASMVIHSGNFRGNRAGAEIDSDRPRRTKDSGKDRRNFSERGGNRKDSFDRGGKGRKAARPLSPEALFSKVYQCRIEKTSDVGAFVAAPDEIMKSEFGKKVAESGLILLPFAEQLGRPARGAEVNVYFYEDKGGRLAATMRAPILRNGELGILTVAAVTKIGVFLDNGVPKQVLLPFKEQILTPEVGDEVLVYVYADKSGRQAATMRVYQHLEKNSPYHEDDRVTGFVYEINPKLGIFVAVDNKYYGLVPIRETFKEYEYGDEIEARVAKVREDGKLDLLIRDKLYKTVDEDANVILYELRRNNGFLPYGDRADAKFIEETYAMSKNQFKRALGHLYKNHIVELDRTADTVRLLK